ncbi:MAG: YigZ family protein [Clostridia bacterium]|nr:YigZ family protein [Clostridia bacterium]
MEGYKTIKAKTSAQIEIKRSRFIATVCPCTTEEEATAFISAMRKKYWDARHNVYAFTLRNNGIKRFSDDGEPHSTAGLPVMEAIEHFGVVDVAVVVTRYFGGILLGTGGLVRAYSEATEFALKSAEVVTVLPAKQFKVVCDYSDYDVFVKQAVKAGARIEDTVYAEKIEITVAIPLEDYSDFEVKCTDVFCGKMPFIAPEDIFLGF